MSRRQLSIGIRVFIFCCLLVSGAFAATEIEVTTYLPVPQGTGNQHLQTLTVGSPYQNENSLADGTVAVSGRVNVVTTSSGSRLFVAGTSDSVGIPNLLLQAGSGQTITNLLELRDAANTTLLRVNPAGGLFVKTNDQNVIPLDIQGVLSQAVDLFRIRDVNANPLFLVNKDGNVGIGTSAPAGRLHLQGPNDAAGIATFMAGADTGTPGVPTMSMGIGTTAPTQRLHVAGVGGANRTLAKFGDAPGALLLLHSDPAIAANAFDDGTWRYDGSGFASVINFQNGMHRFFTAPSGTAGNPVTFTERMRITNTGDVGIGTSVPAGRLHVQGVDDAASLVTFMPGVDLPGGPTPSMKVGIGTTTPTATLEVQGQIKIVDGSQGLDKVLVSSDSSGNATWVSTVSFGPKFITPVMIFPVGSETNTGGVWKTFNVSTYVPATATAVILRAEAYFNISSSPDLSIKIRRDSTSPPAGKEYLFLRLQLIEQMGAFSNEGIYPINTSARTFDYIVINSDTDTKSTIYLIGYF